MPGSVLCLTSTLPRWAGDSTTAFVHHLNQDVQALGWRVEALAPHAPGAERDETLDGVAVHRFRYLWPERAETVFYNGGALANLRLSKANLLKLPPVVAAQVGATALRLGHHDVLHSHWVLPQGFAGVVAARARRRPHVLTVHGSDVFSLSGAVLARFKRFALARADVVTVNSRATEAAVRALAPDLPRVQRIAMGVDVVAADVARVAELRATYRRGDGPLLVFAGRVVREKGLGDLLRALTALRDDLPDLTLLLVGEGRDRAALEAEAAALGLGDRVTFGGWADPGEVPDYLAAADVVVAPSWHEAQGLTVIEALVQGRPLVATRVGGVADTVDDGVHGLLVEPRAPEQLAAALRRVAQDAELAARLGAQGRARAVGQFSRAATAEAFSTVYGELAAR